MNLNDLKLLTAAARDQCRDRALRRVQRLAGQRPTRKRYAIEYGPLAGTLDYLALAVFGSALAISSLNIVDHMGRLASAAYAPSPSGIQIGKQAAVVIFQVASIPLAEFSMIAFLVAFGMAQGWRQWVYLALSGLATCFILLANMTSGVGRFEAVLPAAFTIGVGLRLEALLLEALRRREHVGEQYRAALVEWERAQVEPERHPAYLPFLREELWLRLVSYKVNAAFVDASPEFKREAVQREILAVEWADFPFERDRTTRENGENAHGVRDDFVPANTNVGSVQKRADGRGTMSAESIDLHAPGQK